MKALFADFLKALSQGAVQGARAATEESIRNIERAAEESTIRPAIGGLPAVIEGAALQPQRMVIAERLKMTTSGFLSHDRNGGLCISLKRRVMRKAPEITIEVEFSRSRPMEALELLRDRANEVSIENLNLHRQKLVAGPPLLDQKEEH